MKGLPYGRDCDLFRQKCGVITLPASQTPAYEDCQASRRLWLIKPTWAMKLIQVSEKAGNCINVQNEHTKTKEEETIQEKRDESEWRIVRKYSSIRPPTSSALTLLNST